MRRGRRGPDTGAVNLPLDPDPDLAIDVAGLTKRYGTATVVDDLNFSVRRGELFGLIGTNGAGKTTTVEILQGLRSATGGTAQVLGLDPQRQGDLLRRRLGAQLQASALPERMRVREALELFAALHPAPRPVAEVAEEWSLTELARQPFASLSGGQRQRLFVALAVLGRPELVFLDELTQNLDPVARRHTWAVVRRIREQGTTVVLVTHDVEEAEKLCDRIAVLHRGRVVASGTAAQIVEAAGGAITVRFTDAKLRLDALQHIPGAQRVDRHGPEVTVVGTGAVLAHVGARLVELRRPPADLRADYPSLEDCFLELTGEDVPR